MCNKHMKDNCEPIFNNDTVNAARYVNNNTCPFSSELTEEERLHSSFQ
jgi:hypothetical protein